MTVTTANVLPHPLEDPVPLKPMARVTWLQHRATLIGLMVVYAACAVAILAGELGTHASYAGYVTHGCVAHPYLGPCQSFALGLKVDPFSAMVITLHVLPVVIGVFVGAPLLSRELETGTFRFTWTQGIGRTRFLLTTLVFLAVFVTAAAFVLGILLNWYAHPFEVIGIESRWQSGLFETTGLLLAAWTLFALALGTLLGAAIGRTVAAMAAAAIGVGGLLLGSFIVFVHRLLAVGVLATARFSPTTLGVGVLNTAAYPGDGPPGSWLAEGWLTGRNGGRLHTAAANTVLGRMFEAIKPAVSSSSAAGDPSRWLSLHHYAYWMSYQPESRYWIFQVVSAVILTGFAALLILGTVRVVRRRA